MMTIAPLTPQFQPHAPEMRATDDDNSGNSEAYHNRPPTRSPSGGQTPPHIDTYT